MRRSAGVGAGPKRRKQSGISLRETTIMRIIRRERTPEVVRDASSSSPSSPMGQGADCWQPVKVQRMRIALVAGSVPPAVCGVGDYTFKIAEALRQAKVDVEIITQDRWDARSSRLLLNRIKSSNQDIIHIQYPTVNYGSGLAPHLLSLLCRKPVVVTLHEFKYSHILRRMACGIFALSAKHIIFPNKEDQDAFKSRYSLIARSSSIIPLGSNIPWIAGPVTTGNRICYFGIIRPDKGIEDFIDLARLISKNSCPYVLEIVGSPAAQNVAYYESLRQKTVALPIEWSSNLGPDDVARRLREATCAYLPFPGGASERRGSLLAVMGNGVPVITTDGPGRPPEMSKAVRFAANPAEALAAIVDLTQDLAQAETLVAEARKYLVDFSWPKIADDHVAIYKQLLRVG